jgi:hypothetical protein
MVLNQTLPWLVTKQCSQKIPDKYMSQPLKYSTLHHPQIIQSIFYINS